MFTGFWIYKEYRIMSLDTVLKIGNILRNLREKMSFSNAVVSCRPKDNGDWPFCLSLPVDKTLILFLIRYRLFLRTKETVCII